MNSTKSILVLGGTAWLGGAIAAAARDAGHDVTCLARGESGDVPAGVSFVSSDRWALSAYDEVAGRSWDAVVDVSWQPELVRSALAALSARARHWIYVSSVSVYADHASPDADETAPLVGPWLGSGVATLAEYGGAKVSCETECRSRVPDDRLLVARPGLIVGHGDRSDRFGYWPARFARADVEEEVLAPPLDSSVQVIDVEDLASWIAAAVGRGLAGTFDAIGDTHDFAQVVAACVEATGMRPRIVSPGDEWLSSQEVEPWAGPESMPLWLPSSYAGMSSRSGRRGRTAGLAPRPLQKSVESALRWERELGVERSRKAGLSPGREAELLNRWHADEPAGDE
jgi:2'-hydroxyisoflavone reductase